MSVTLEASTYHVKIRGNDVAVGAVYPGKLLAMDAGVASGRLEGHKTIEPAFGLDAYWISPAQKDQAEAMNYTVVDPSSVLATHLTEIAKARLRREHDQKGLNHPWVDNALGRPRAGSAPLGHRWGSCLTG